MFFSVFFHIKHVKLVGILVNVKIVSSVVLVEHDNLHY